MACFKSYLRSHILPAIGDAELSTFGNGAMKAFVQTLVDKNLSPKTVTEIAALVRAIVAAAVDSEGQRLFDVRWNLRFVDLPDIGKQRSATVTPEQLEAALHSEGAWNPKKRELEYSISVERWNEICPDDGARVNVTPAVEDGVAKGNQ